MNGKHPLNPPNKPSQGVEEEIGPNLPLPTGNASETPPLESRWKRRKDKRKKFLISMALDIMDKNGEIALMEICRIISRSSCYSPTRGQMGQLLRPLVRNGKVRKQDKSDRGTHFIYYWKPVLNTS